MRENKKTVRIRIFGLVQAVGFRDFVVGKAQDLKLAGWVRNVSDGSVEVMCNGSDQSIEDAIKCFKKGPSTGRVDKLDICIVDPLGHGGSFPSTGFNQIADFVLDIATE